MKVWITKYALTRGILEREGTQVQPGMISVKEQGRATYFHGNDWQLTQADAVEDARTRRARKIAALKKQITKLEKMEF